MRRYASMLIVVPLLFLAGCFPYYADYTGAYEPTPPVVDVPVLPPTVVLERPYYLFGGFYYYWDVDRDFWLYSRSGKGPWYRLPPSHYPERFQYRGHWHEGRGRGHDRGRGRD